MSGEIEDIILQLERGALDRWGKGETAGVSELYAPDVSYFDPVAASRIDGAEAMRRYYEPWEGKISVPRYDIVNPSVVTGGDWALLTYNLVNYARDADGAETLGSRWNCTEVYRRDEAGWRIIHSHWSFSRHPAFQNMTPQETESGF